MYIPCVVFGCLLVFRQILVAVYVHPIPYLSAKFGPLPKPGSENDNSDTDRNFCDISMV